MSDTARPDDFTPHVGGMFRFDGWHGALRLVVVETGRVTGAPPATRAAFTLIFHGPRGDILREGLHTAEAETGDRFTFYIMPIHTPAPDRQDYQAVFN